MSETTTVRFRVSIPEEAEQLIEWFKNQSNISYAVMDVLRDYIAQNGTGNVFARRIESIQTRGRPKNELRNAVIDIDAPKDIEQESPESMAADVSKQTETKKSPKQLGPKKQQNLDDDGFFDFEKATGQGESADAIADMLNNI
jgi:hypothetical protein